MGNHHADTLTFELDSPYFLDPEAGNLLLDVQITDAADAGDDTRVLSAVRNSTVVSRVRSWHGLCI